MYIVRGSLNTIFSKHNYEMFETIKISKQNIVFVEKKQTKYFIKYKNKYRLKSAFCSLYL